MQSYLPTEDVQVCLVPCLSAAANKLMLLSCTALSLTESQKAEAKETYEVI